MNDELDEIAGLIAAVAMAGVALAAPRLPATAAIVPVPPGQKAYVALPDNNEVAVVATRTHQVLAYVPVSSAPTISSRARTAAKARSRYGIRILPRPARRHRGWIRRGDSADGHASQAFLRNIRRPVNDCAYPLTRTDRTSKFTFA